MNLRFELPTVSFVSGSQYGSTLSVCADCPDLNWPPSGEFRRRTYESAHDPQ